MHISILYKKKQVSGCHSAVQVGHCIMDRIKFEFNDIISLYKKNDSERKRSVRL